MANTLFTETLSVRVRLSALAIAGISCLTTSTTPAQAVSLTLDPQPFTGSPASAKVTLDDQLDGAGRIRVKVDVGGIADLRGLFFNVADDSLLTGLQISGLNYLNALGNTISVANKNIQYSFSAGNVTSVGSKNNTMNGDGGSHTFDAGVEIGKEGIGKGDDFRSAWFTLSLSDAFLGSAASSRAQSGLQLSDFFNQSFGVRLMSVGVNRDGSSKLAGTAPSLSPVVTPPEPPIVVVASPPAVEVSPTPIVSNPPATNVSPVAVTPSVPEQPQQPTPVPEPGTNTAIALMIMLVYRWLKRHPQAQQPS